MATLVLVAIAGGALYYYYGMPSLPAMVPRIMPHVTDPTRSPPEPGHKKTALAEPGGGFKYRPIALGGAGASTGEWQPRVTRGSVEETLRWFNYDKHFDKYGTFLLKQHYA